jgi:tRNA (guanine37-N1)-methyltransferase
MKINILTLFPNIIKPFLEVLPYKRAIDAEVLEIKVWNLRDFAIDKRGTVDARPYSGGKGMIIRIEPIYDALKAIADTSTVPKAKNLQNTSTDSRTILLSPKGKPYTQAKARELKTLKEITLICGRYEGIDNRVAENLADETISVGNYVLSGGELPAMVITESIARLLPNVLDAEATQKESFSIGSAVEYPQYTRPEEFNGWKVPEILLSGNHAEIEKWKREHTEKQK